MDNRGRTPSSLERAPQPLPFGDFLPYPAVDLSFLQTHDDLWIELGAAASASSPLSQTPLLRFAHPLARERAVHQSAPFDVLEQFPDRVVVRVEVDQDLRVGAQRNSACVEVRQDLEEARRDVDEERAERGRREGRIDRDRRGRTDGGRRGSWSGEGR